MQISRSKPSFQYLNFHFGHWITEPFFLCICLFLFMFMSLFSPYLSSYLYTDWINLLLLLFRYVFIILDEDHDTVYTTYIVIVYIRSLTATVRLLPFLFYLRPYLNLILCLLLEEISIYPFHHYLLLYSQILAIL